MAGCSQPSSTAPSPAPSVTKISVMDVPKPYNPIDHLNKCSLVTIELSYIQSAELKRMGVDTNEIKITTYDISRLGTAMHN